MILAIKGCKCSSYQTIIMVNNYNEEEYELPVEIEDVEMLSALRTYSLAINTLIFAFQAMKM